MEMTTIQIRIDSTTKASAKKILDQIGLDFSAAIKVYLKQIAIQKSIPFTLLTKNHLTPAVERAILQANSDAQQDKNVTKPMSIRKAIQYLEDL